MGARAEVGAIAHFKMLKMQRNSRLSTSSSGWQYDSIMMHVKATGLEILTLYLMMICKIRGMKRQLVVLKAKTHIIVKPGGLKTKMHHLTKTKVLQMPEM